MPTTKTEAIARHRPTNTSHSGGWLAIKHSTAAAGGMSFVAGMRVGARVFRTVALYSLIVAIYATGVAHPLRAQTPVPDLSGRWTSARGNYVLDITGCGDDWCGVRLKADRSCGALALRLSARPDATNPHRLAGTLNLDASVQLSRITATAMPLDAARPAELRLSGAPDTSGVPTRVIPFIDRLVRGPDAACRHDGKVS